MLEYELVDANEVCQGIQKVRVEPATRSAVATCKEVSYVGWLVIKLESVRTVTWLLQDQYCIYLSFCLLLYIFDVSPHFIVY